VIRGRVSARSIAMARGATIDGDVIVTSGEPIVQFEEKRGGGKR
jgi:cytoskeletal protein CcmA (bactofilin family)